MAGVSYESLDVEQGFNYNRDVQSPFGFLYSVQIGDGTQITIASDITVKEPTGTEKTPTVAGVLASITWDGGHGDGIKLKAMISTPNKQKIAKLLHEKLNNTTCKFAFCVFDYDPVAKKWFQSFYPAKGETTQLDGLILKEDKKLVLELDKEPGSVKSPQNWGLTLGIMPAPTQQDINYLAGDQMAVTKKWGITVVTSS